MAGELRGVWEQRELRSGTGGISFLWLKNSMLFWLSFSLGRGMACAGLHGML